jgi:hypothetical protein
MEEMGPGGIGLRVDHADEVARAGWRVGPERVAQLGLREAARRLFAEHPLAREEAQDAVERVGIAAGGLRQILGAPRALVQQIGDAELGGDIERLGDGKAETHAQQVLRCRAHDPPHPWRPARGVSLTCRRPIFKPPWPRLTPWPERTL